MRPKNLPSWTRKLFSERKFRKAVIRAAKMDAFEITAMWDRGNAWDSWENDASGNWHHRATGMTSQMPVPVSVSGTTIRSPKENGSDVWTKIDFQADEVAWKSFWNWGN